MRPTVRTASTTMVTALPTAPTPTVMVFLSSAWCVDSSGQLGLGDLFPRGDGPGEMGDSLPAVSLGSGQTAVALTAGRFHTCALLDNSSVKCWGYNGDGQLGLGDTANRGDGSGEMGDSLPAVDLGP